MLGPIDYVVVGFKGNNFDGSIVDELSKAVGQGIIKVIDFVFILKDETGRVLAGEYEDQPEELKDVMSSISIASDMPLLTETDIEKVARSIPEDTAAGVLVIEHLWAKGLKKALIDAGGVLIADGRIHSDNAEAALQELKQTS